jgi:hypothetical protein
MSSKKCFKKVKIILDLPRPLFVCDPAAGGGNQSAGGDQEGEHREVRDEPAERAPPTLGRLLLLRETEVSQFILFVF